jgi:uncharacterized protein with GYD domain
MSTVNEETFSEENAANYVNGRFDPKGAQALREGLRRQAEVRAKLDAEARTLAQRHCRQLRDER